MLLIESTELISRRPSNSSGPSPLNWNDAFRSPDVADSSDMLISPTMNKLLVLWAGLVKTFMYPACR